MNEETRHKDVLAAILTAGYIVNTRFEEEGLDKLVNTFRAVREKLEGN